MKKIYVKRQVKKNIYVHNDLSNVAYHLRSRIEKMESSGNREGISLDIMTCLVMLAFTFEARINFLGHKVVSGWNERKSFHEKVNKVLSALSVTPDHTNRPFSTIEKLKKLRDLLAHGKPVNIELNETVVDEPEAISASLDLSAEWEADLNIEFIRQCEEDIDEIWRSLQLLAGIELLETLTSGEYHTTRIEKFADIQIQ